MPNQCRNASRSGVAALEMILGFTILVTVWVTIATVYSSARTRNRVAIRARHEAFDRRHYDWNDGGARGSLQTQYWSSIGRILGPSPPYPAAQGLSESYVTEEVPHRFANFRDLPEAEGFNAVYAGSWDYHQIPFESHPRLTLDQRATFFIPGFGGFDFASALASLAPIPPSLGSNEDVRAVIEQLRQRAIAEMRNRVGQIRNKINDLNFQIERLKSRIRRAERRLAVERRNIPRDEELIRELESEIRKLNRELDNRVAERDELQVNLNGLEASIASASGAGNSIADVFGPLAEQ